MKKKSAKREDTSDKPWVANYPSLQDWLNAINARCDWQQSIGGNPDIGGYVEQWRLAGALPFLVVIRPRKLGWEIYTPIAKGSLIYRGMVQLVEEERAVIEQLRDLERRLPTRSAARRLVSKMIAQRTDPDAPPILVTRAG